MDKSVKYDGEVRLTESASYQIIKGGTEPQPEVPLQPVPEEPSNHGYSLSDGHLAFIIGASLSGGSYYWLGNNGQKNKGPGSAGMASSV